MDWLKNYTWKVVVNMYKKYKVSFTIQGDILTDDFTLNKKNIKLILDKEFNAKSKDYYGNRNLDTYIEDLKIERIKLPF